jgi:hypothetical protein
VLPDGEVTAVDVVAFDDHMVSRSWRLRLQYTEPIAGAPERLFLKMPTGARPTLPGKRVPKEFAFYDQVPRSDLAGCVPRCFEAHWDEATGATHILLEDLAESPVTATTWPIAPSRSECERMVRALAGVHAVWWEDARLGTSVGKRPDAAFMTTWAAAFGKQVDHFITAAGDWLSAERRSLLLRLVERAPQVLAYGDRRPMTLAHGDAHAWNCFLARDPGTHRDVWYDWDNWRVDLGAADLAYFMALHWYPERRRRFESHLLDCYAEELARRGVAGYGREELGEDYRLAVLWQVATPIKQHFGSLPPLVWWGHLERILLAVDDLGCRELLD